MECMDGSKTRWQLNTGDPSPLYQRDPSIQNLIHKLQARSNPLSAGTNRTRNASDVSLTKVTTGFDRAQRVQEMCKYMREGVCRTGSVKSPYCSTANKVRVDYVKQRKFMFCPMCKMASTFWTRVFRMVSQNDDKRNTKQLDTPYDVPISDAPASSYYYDTHRKVVLSNNHVDFKFMFVRDPFVMLFSTYVDKIIGPNPVYWKEFGVEATTRLRQERSKVCGADVTFVEFLNHVIHRFTTDRKSDCHFAKFATCNPCSVNYDFIGKMETFKTDTFDILTMLNQTNTVKILNNEFSNMHAMDAVEDSISGPYDWKADIVKCIPWHEALKRIWRKLQIRGVLGPTPFPLTDDESENISKEDLIALVLDKRKDSASSERKVLKDQAYVEAYNSVNSDVVEGIKNVYKEEFEIFDYDTKPFNNDIDKKTQQDSKVSLLDLSKV